MTTPNRPDAAEPLAYVGSALVLAFGALGVALTWDRMSAGTQVVVLGVAALVVAVAALLIPTVPVGLGRAADVGAASAAVLAGWAAGLGASTLGADVPRSLAIGATVGGAAGGAAWLRRRGAVPHVVAGAGAVGALVWLAVDLDLSHEVVVLVGLVAGLAWWSLGVASFVHPPRVALVAGGVHAFGAATAALAFDAAWLLAPIVVAVAAFAVASMQTDEVAIHRSLAVATGLVAVAKLGLLIDDPVLRFVVAGMGVGVALVVAAATVARRPERLGSGVDGADD